MAKLTPPINKNDHVQGPPDGIVTLVEYGDYQYPPLWRGLSYSKETSKSTCQKFTICIQALSLVKCA